MSRKVFRTAVAEYGDSMPGVLEVCILEAKHEGEFLTIGAQDGDDSIVVGTAAQARQLIEALKAGINKIWE